MNEQSRSLEGDYFNWLYSLVASTSNPNPSRSYFQLLEMMHTKRFTWFIPNDDNRVEDGLELRYEYRNGPLETEDCCSFLEMLIALSRRAGFETDQDPAEWFWHLTDNMGLRQYSDEVFMDSEPGEVRYILDRVVDREYDRNGHGGLFPLQNPSGDQTKVELWYQLSSYLLEGQGP